MEGEEPEVQAPSQEELAALKEKAAKVETLEKEHAETQAKLKALEEDEQNINWRKSRKQIEAMKKALEREGKTLDENSDEVKTTPSEVSPEDIDRRAEAATERVLISKSVQRAQKELSDDDKKVFQKFYEKATYGEVVTSDNVDDFVDMAFKLAGTGAVSKTMSDRSAGARGGAPRTQEASKDYAESDAGKAVFNKMFKTEADLKGRK